MDWPGVQKESLILLSGKFFKSAFYKVFTLSVNNKDKTFEQQIGLHQYIYNIGSTPINLHTGEHTEEINQEIHAM